jgi:hypothetical protein
MRFGIITIACLTGSAIAFPFQSGPQRRDVSVINRSFQRLTNSLNMFIAAIKVRPKGGDVNEARRQTNKLLGLAHQVISDARQGSKEIRAGPQVVYLEGLSLLGSVTNLGNLITTATNGWTDSNVQDMVKASGMRNDVLRTLKETADSMKENGDAIIAKLPILDGAGAIANAVAQTFVSLVDNAIKVYSKVW